MRSHGEAAKGFACVPQPQWLCFGLAFNTTAEERGEIRRFHKLTVTTPPTRRNRDINLEHNKPTVAGINRSRRKRAFKKRQKQWFGFGVGFPQDVDGRAFITIAKWLLLGGGFCFRSPSMAVDVNSVKVIFLFTSKGLGLVWLFKSASK